MAEEWESLHSKFAARVSKHRGGSSSHSPSPFLQSKSFTLSTTSSHGSASSLSRGRDLDPADSRDRSGSDSSRSHSGGATPQPQPHSHYKSTPCNYVNIDTLSVKPATVLSGEEEMGRSNVGGYETPSVSVKKEKDEEPEEEGEEKEEEKEEECRREGPHPSYANWQFLTLQTSSPTKPTSVGIQKKPVPLQRKLPSGTDAGLSPSSSVHKKPLTAPKPKMLQLSTKPFSIPLLSPTSQTSSIKHVNESASMWMPANPVHSLSANKTKPSATPNSSFTDGAKTKGASGSRSVHPLPETKPRSYTTSTLDKKQPLLPPVKGSTVSTLFSSKSPQQIPKEQISDTPLSPLQEVESDTSQFEASSEHSPTDKTKLLAKGPKPSAATTAASSSTSTSRDGRAPKSTGEKSASSSGGREELMRKLSLRRQKLEQQIQVTVNKADSPTSQSTVTTVAERTSEYSHDSSSSTQSELVLTYRRTDESPSGSTGNADGSVVLRKPDSDKEGNLAKYGIIEDVNGGSFVI